MNLSELGRLKAVERHVIELTERIERIEHRLEELSQLQKVVADLRYDDAVQEA